MATILVTGAAGWIGSHLARELLDAGHQVVAPVRSSSDLSRVAEMAGRLAIETCDLEDVTAMRALVARFRPEIAYHLAWNAVPGQYLHSRENLRSVEASLHFAEALVDAGCRRLVVTGTCFEYDTDLGKLSEESPTHPKFLYSASKLAVYQILSQLVPRCGASLAWVRLFYQYGPSEDKRRLVSSIVNGLLRGQEVSVTPGLQLRDFLHVADVASALAAVGASNLSGVINVGSGQPTTVARVAQLLGDQTGRPELVKLGARPYRSGDPMEVVAVARRLFEEVGWQPRYTLESGLADTVEWWRTRLLAETQA